MKWNERLLGIGIPYLASYSQVFDFNLDSIVFGNLSVKYTNSKFFQSFKKWNMDYKIYQIFLKCWFLKTNTTKYTLKHPNFGISKLLQNLCNTKVTPLHATTAFPIVCKYISNWGWSEK